MELRFGVRRNCGEVDGGRQGGSRANPAGPILTRSICRRQDTDDSSEHIHTALSYSVFCILYRMPREWNAVLCS